MENTKCPYCGENVKYNKSSEFIYKKNYGGVYYCENYPKCDSYVGTHRGTKKSLGRLANATLRENKKYAHYYFDFLWKEKQKMGHKNARKLGYAWLSRELGLPKERTHIGMFDEATCEKVIKLCKPYMIRIKYRREDK